MSWRSRSRSLLLFALVATALPTPANACPSVCRCIGRVRVAVYCDFRDLESVPANIPLETTHLCECLLYLFLMGNKFTRVQPEMLLGNAQNADGSFVRTQSALAKLKVIRLDLNPITVVNEHAFDAAPMLELIYLPFDVKIQRQAFAEMKTDKHTFDGFTRVREHPLEDPHFAAFSKYE